jgi:hypothetical protein
VPTRQEGDEQSSDHGVLAHDNSLHLNKSSFEVARISRVRVRGGDLDPSRVNRLGGDWLLLGANSMGRPSVDFVAGQGWSGGLIGALKHGVSLLLELRGLIGDAVAARPRAHRARHPRKAPDEGSKVQRKSMAGADFGAAHAGSTVTVYT